MRGKFSSDKYHLLPGYLHTANVKSNDPLYLRNYQPLGLATFSRCSLSGSNNRYRLTSFKEKSQKFVKKLSIT